MDINAEIDILATQYLPDVYATGKDDQAVADAINAATSPITNNVPVTFMMIAAQFGITDPQGARDLLTKLFSQVESDLLTKVVVDRLVGVGADLTDPLVRSVFESLRAVVGDDMTNQILKLGIDSVSVVQARIGRDCTAQDVADARTAKNAAVTIQTLTNLAAGIYMAVLEEIKTGKLTTDVDTKKRIIALAS